MLADTARLAVQLDLKGNFSGQLKASQKALSGFDSQVSRTGTRAYKAGTQIGTGIKTGAVIAAGAIGFLALNVGKGLQSLTELESVTTQTNAVLKSTKGVAGQTADSVRNLAEKYEGLNAVIDDKVIQSAENVLLTFTNIRKQAFEPTLKAALDMSTALGTDLQGSVIQIGKALQDPIKGITALRRVGVNFSQDQIKVIKKLVESNDLLGAQKVILKELNTEFGGSFLAQGQTTAGKVAKFKDAIEDLQKALATALLPTIGKIADALTKFLADPKVIAEVSRLGEKIAGLFSDKNLTAGANVLKGAFETFKSAAPFLEAAAKSTLGFIQAAVGVFKSLPEPLQAVVAGGFALNKLTGGLVTNVAGGIADLIGKARGATPANPVFVADVSGGLGGAAGAVGGAGLLGKAGNFVAKVAVVGIAAEVASQLIGPIQQLGTDIHQSIFGKNGDPFSDFGKAWENWRKNADWPFGQKNAPEWAGGSSPKNNITGVNAKAAGASSSIIVNAQTGFAVQALAGKLKDDTAIVTATLSVISNEFKNIAGALKHSGSKSEIKNAIAEAMKLIGGGRGDATNTGNVLAGLKAALKRTHDPELQRELKAAIGKVEHVLPGRQFAAKQLAKADSILKSNERSGQKIKDLQSIEKSLRDRGLPHAADRIRAKIDQAKKEQIYAQHAATQAIKDKDLSVTLRNNITNNITVRSIINGTQLVSTYGHTLSTKGGFVAS